MSILEKHIPFVNKQIAFQGKMAQKFKDDPFRKALHESTLEGFKTLVADLTEAGKMLNGTTLESHAKIKPVGRIRLNLTPDEIQGLPDDVLEELSISGADKTEFAILGLMEDAGGIMSLDQLIVGLYKKTGEKHKRQTLTSRLYRMAQKEQIFSVPNKKGVYSNSLVTEEEVERLTVG